jgi:predicted transcriptional regulator
MQTRVLLSVKPQFAEAILAGTKTFEFRRLLFKREDVRTIVIYASSPTRKVVGEFTLDKVLTLKLDELWATTCNGSGIERSYFDEYFEGRSTGHALKVKETRRYRSPRCLRKDFGISHPPQSFCYIES